MHCQWKIYVRIRIASDVSDHGVGPCADIVEGIGMGQTQAKINENLQEKEEIVNEEDNDLEGILIGGESKGKKVEEDGDPHDSNYTFSDDSDNEVEGNSEIPRAMVVVNGEPPKLGDENEVESNYAGFEKLNSCSSIDEDELVSNKCKHSEFNDEFDMKNPQFKVGRKFRSFKQFREAVKTQGIL